MTRHHVVDAVERAVRAEPHCAACGAPTVVVSDAEGIRLECASLQERRSFLHRIVAPDGLHTRTRIVDTEDLLAA